jgi:hypothetical protein
MSTTEIAEKFVNLILKYENWREVKNILEEEIQVLFELVSTAGHNPKQIVPGRLFEDIYDEQGRATGEKSPVNYLCPYKAIDQNDSDNFFATGWLDCALRRVFGCKKIESKDRLIKVIDAEIVRSVPLQPVQITVVGDFLREYPPKKRTFAFNYFVDHARDDSILQCCVGIHESLQKPCNGWMERFSDTDTEDSIICQKCHLMVLFPKEIRTYGGLRQEIAKGLLVRKTV